MKIVRLDKDEISRYSRHLPVIGLDGQKKLKQARVLCVGAGGLGCPALQYLAASGIGVLGIMDGDKVDISNLHRQILFTEADVGQSKAVTAATRLQAMNQHLVVDVYPEFFQEHHRALIERYDIILDATDNYPARYALNTVCRDLKKPLVSASIYQFEAQISVFHWQDGPCYQCLYPSPPKEAINCSLAGVLNVLPGVAGTLQATETIKIILGLEGILSGRLLCINLLSMRFTQFEIPKQICNQHPMITFENTHACEMPSSSSNVETSISAKDLYRLLKSSEASTLQLIDVRQPYEREICHIGGLLIPLAEFADSLHQLDKNKPLILYCRSGVRSQQALDMCLNAGFKQVKHLAGGILDWQSKIDSNLVRY
jgi:sulfur-carrier protein adenylyltransferase/sulfurtransferase